MNGTDKYCHSCQNWEWEEDIVTQEGRHIHHGKCALQSCNCINAVITGKTPPPWYQAIELRPDYDLQLEREG